MLEYSFAWRGPLQHRIKENKYYYVRGKESDDSNIVTYTVYSALINTVCEQFSGKYRLLISRYNIGVTRGGLEA